jgi:hypothetical protein
LFSFNIGVEIGQLLFVGGVLLLYLVAKRIQPAPPAWAWRVPTYAIGGMAAYWTIDRIVGFWI